MLLRVTRTGVLSGPSYRPPHAHGLVSLDLESMVKALGTAFLIFQ